MASNIGEMTLATWLLPSACDNLVKRIQIIAGRGGRRKFKNTSNLSGLAMVTSR